MNAPELHIKAARDGLFASRVLPAFEGNPVLRALLNFRSAVIGVSVFSGIVNLLMLTSPLFMLQVYDRVVPSHSIPTLTALVILMVTLFIFMGVLDYIRGRILFHIGRHLEESLGDNVLSFVLDSPLRSAKRGAGMQAARDLDQLKQFVGSSGPIAIFDLPWTPVYIAVVFFLHSLLGLVATAGAVVLLVMAILSESGIRKPMQLLSGKSVLRQARIEAGRRNAEVLRALGMRRDFLRRYQETNQRYAELNRQISETTASFGTVTKTFRFILQSLILAIGALLVVNQVVSPGVMFAASLIASRALAPIEMAVAQWRGFVGARQSYQRLSELLRSLPPESERMELPPPSISLTVQEVGVIPPGSNRLVVSGVKFALRAGDGLGVIGPSASGKSALARALVGIWPAARGSIRFDGAAIEQWAPDTLGPHIGYLPQDVELFDGTVAENISRFETDADSTAIIAAARSAGAHSLILGLSKGYDTEIGEGGCVLSAGQRQRIALARALYKDPFLIVLDEPNSNVDAEGEAALIESVKTCRSRGAIVVLIAHRPSIIAAVDQLLVLNGGQVVAFGAKDEVLRKTVVAVNAAQGGAPARVAESA